MRILIRPMPHWVKVFLKRVEVKERRDLVIKKAGIKLRNALVKVKGVNRFKM